MILDTPIVNRRTKGKRVSLPSFDLYSSLGFLLVNTSFQVKQNLTAIFQREGFDATVDQFRVMGALFGKDGMTQKQICEISCKNDSNLTRIFRAYP